MVITHKNFKKHMIEKGSFEIYWTAEKINLLTFQTSWTFN